MNIVEAYPLLWPPAHPRTPGWKRGAARFGKRNIGGYGRVSLTIGQARDRLMNQLRQLGARKIIINSDLRVRLDGLPYAQQPNPDDVGVAVYFDLNSEPHCLPCDRWNRIADNLAAIAGHVKAARDQERWGVGDVKARFAGFTALPPGRGEMATGGIILGPPWWEVLGVKHKCGNFDVVERYRVLVREHHPDHGGEHERMASINTAYQDFKQEREL